MGMDHDLKLVNLNENVCYDLDEYYDIKMIQRISYERTHKAFYVCANMHQEKLGFYVLKISEDEPKSGVFMIKLPNRLNFGDVNITFINDPEKHYQEVVISYKTAYINTYNILVLEADTLGNDQYIIYRHESFQLWESKIQGTIL